MSKLTVQAMDSAAAMDEIVSKARPRCCHFIDNQIEWKGRNGGRIRHTTQSNATKDEKVY